MSDTNLLAFLALAVAVPVGYGLLGGALWLAGSLWGSDVAVGSGKGLVVGAAGLLLFFVLSFLLLPVAPRPLVRAMAYAWVAGPFLAWASPLVVGVAGGIRASDAEPLRWVAR